MNSVLYVQIFGRFKHGVTRGLERHVWCGNYGTFGVYKHHAKET